MQCGNEIHCEIHVHFRISYTIFSQRLTVGWFLTDDILATKAIGIFCQMYAGDFCNWFD
jgi:hypothetical protein